MSVLSIRVLQNTQKVVICGRDSPNTQLSSIRPWTITAAYLNILFYVRSINITLRTKGLIKIELIIFLWEQCSIRIIPQNI